MLLCFAPPSDPLRMLQRHGTAAVARFLAVTTLLHTGGFVLSNMPGGVRASHFVVWQPGAFVHPSGTRKALLVGCNYRGTDAELRGCINDVHAMRDLLASEGFPHGNMTILTDDNHSMLPTRANILRGMQWLVAGAEQGDVFFFHFSGHGSQQR